MIACEISCEQVKTSLEGRYGYEWINRFEKEWDNEMNKWYVMKRKLMWLVVRKHGMIYSNEFLKWDTA